MAASDTIEVKVKLIDEMSADLKKIRSNMETEMTKVRNSSKKAQEGFKNLGKEAGDNLSASFTKLGKSMIAVSSAVAVFNFLKKAVAASEEAALAQSRLTQALGYTSQALNDQANALMTVTLYDDDAITSAQAMLATWVKNEEQLKRLTPVLLDMATATGMDLTAAAQMMGRAIADDGAELGRLKIKVDGAAGSEERLNSIIAGVNANMGGQAKAAADASNGFTQLNNALGEVMQMVGDTLLPDIKDLTNSLKENSAEWASLAGTITNVVLAPFRVSIAQMLTMSSLIAKLTGQSLAAAALWDEAKIAWFQVAGREKPEPPPASGALPTPAKTQAQAMIDAFNKAEEDAQKKGTEDRKKQVDKEAKEALDLLNKLNDLKIQQMNEGSEKERAQIAAQAEKLLQDYTNNRVNNDLIAKIIEAQLQNAAIAAKKEHQAELRALAIEFKNEDIQGLKEGKDKELALLDLKFAALLEKYKSNDDALSEIIIQRDIEMEKITGKPVPPTGPDATMEERIAAIKAEFGLNRETLALHRRLKMEMLDVTKSSNQLQMELLDRSRQEELKKYEDDARAKHFIDKKYDLLKQQLTKKQQISQTQAALSSTGVALNAMAQVANASKADAEVKRKIAQGLAIVNTAKAVTEYLAQPWLIPFIIASGMAQVAMIQNQKFAQGGYSRAGMAMVGERGPEMVQLPAGSKIYNNEDTKERMQTSTGTSIVFNVTATSTAIVDEFRKMIRTGDANGFLSDIKSSSYFRG